MVVVVVGAAGQGVVEAENRRGILGWCNGQGDLIQENLEEISSNRSSRLRLGRGRNTFL